MFDDFMFVVRWWNECEWIKWSCVVGVVSIIVIFSGIKKSLDSCDLMWKLNYLLLCGGWKCSIDFSNFIWFIL